jgi:hypothetical protein
VSGAAPEEFFAGVPVDLDERTRAVVGDLRSLLARVNAANAQPQHTSVVAPQEELVGYLELHVAHPRGDPHLTVSCGEDDLCLFWTGGGLLGEPAWQPRHLQIVECLLTGRNNLEVRRRRGRIVSTAAEFWPPSGERIGPIHTETPPAPGLRGKLVQRVNALKPGSSLTIHFQVSF